MSKILTIFTPTYNRAHLLPRVFASLQSQTSFNFEWLIVDDGSTDNTEVLIQDFLKENNSFPIRYFKQENGGKHRAINRGVREAEGNYFVILDSDDELLQEACNLLENKIKKIKNNKQIGGVAGRKMYLDGNMVGGEDSFGELLANCLSIRYKHHIQGDLGEVFKTSVLREFPFPEFEREKFCPEALVWNRIAQKYELLYFNDGFYIADYQPNGLTSSIVKIRMDSPQASILHYAELASYKIPFKEKAKAGINYWRFAYNAKQISFHKKIKQIGWWSLSLILLGYAMYVRDKKNHS